jgi:hypothetical protein
VPTCLHANTLKRCNLGSQRVEGEQRLMPVPNAQVFMDLRRDIVANGCPIIRSLTDASVLSARSDHNRGVLAIRQKSLKPIRIRNANVCLNHPAFVP